MGSGGGGGSSTGLAGKKRKASSGDLPERREPRRGLGVAALEALMAARLETPTPLIGYFPGSRFDPFVGNGDLQRKYWHQQHYVPQQQQYYTADVFARIFHASSGSRQSLDQSGVMAAPLLLQARHQQQHRHRQPQAQHDDGEMVRRPQITTVDEVDAGAGEELDLELRL